jgi:type IV pilus secretin PilQ/predicted competence protein
MRKNKILVSAVLFAFLFNCAVSAQEVMPAQAAPVPAAPPPPPKNADPFSEKITVDYKDVDINDILRSLSYTYGLNLVTSSEVKGRVTISLKDVLLSEGLDAILGANGYNYNRKGNIIYITPGTVEGAQVVTTPVTLKYLKAADAQNLVRKALSPKGDIKVDEIANMLIVTDYPASIEKLKELLKAVDQPPRQVLIEAKIVDIQTKDYQNLGVTWQLDYQPAHGLFTRSVANAAERVKGTGAFAGPSSNVSGGQFKLDTFVIKGLTASATIDALIQDQKAHLLASPSIAVLNNREARIIIGEKVPYKERTQTTTGTTETTKFVDVGTTLRVLPSINADGYITLSIHPEVSSVKALLDAGPQITTREADTVVRVKEGETIVIGGLIKQEDNRTRSRFPVLGYLPGVGWLFSNRSKDQVQTELAVFITPKILLSREEMLKEKKNHYEEEAYVNIMSSANLNAQRKLFEKARRLQLGDEVEVGGKEDWQRKNQALSLYECVLTQFPDGPKAAEAGYQAAVLYRELGELYLSKQACAKVINNYPDSEAAFKAKRLRSMINMEMRKDARRKAEEEIAKIKALLQEENFQRMSDEEERQLKEKLQRTYEQAREEEARKAQERQGRAAAQAQQRKEIARAAQEAKQAEAGVSAAEKARQEEADKEKEFLRQRQEAEKQLAGKRQLLENKNAEKARLEREVREKARQKAQEAARQQRVEQEKARLEREAQLKAKREKEEGARREKAAKETELARKKQEAALAKEFSRKQAAEQQARAREEAQRARQQAEARRAAELEHKKEERRLRVAVEERSRQEARQKAQEAARLKQEQLAREKKAAQERQQQELARKREAERMRQQELARQKEAQRQQREMAAARQKALREKLRRQQEEKARLEAQARQKAQEAARLKQEARRREEARRKAQETLAAQAKQAKQSIEEEQQLQQEADARERESLQLQQAARDKALEEASSEAALKQSN